MNKIGLIGSTGYIGGYIKEALIQRKLSFEEISRDSIFSIDFKKFSIVINAAGYTGKPNVDSCEENKGDCIDGNITFVAELFRRVSCPLLHISSGCIFEGNGPFKENDEPNFKESFYSRSKIEGEKQLIRKKDCYIVRLRIPFDDKPGDRNYLTKLLKYENLISKKNSLTYLPEFANACLDLFEKKAPYGIYHITNPGAISAEEICELFKKYGLKDSFNFIDYEQFEKTCKAKRSNCVLDSTKILEFSNLTPVHVAIENCIKNYQK